MVLQNTGETCDVAGVVEDSRVEMHPQLASNPQQDLAMDHIKETSIDHGVVDNAYLHPAVLNSPPVHDCVVLGNQVAIEMQEPLTTGHYKHNEQNETTFVTNGNSTESDGCNSIITNKHCEPDYKPPSPNYEQHQPDYKPPYPNYEQCQPDYKPPSTTYEQCQPDYKPPSPSLRPGSNKPDEPEYKPPAGQRDILFPMRDQKSLLEIKQVSVRGVTIMWNYIST